MSEEHIDRKNAFLLYATFCGDVERTGHAIGVSPMVVLRVADEEGWAEKLKSIIDLKKSHRPGDIERGINRALNFVQAFRMRLFLERVVTKLSGLTEAEMDEYIFAEGEVKKNEDKVTFKKLTTRALADLTSAIEKCHALTYLALNDTVQDRTRRKEQAEDTENAAGELHVAIAKAMAAAGDSNSPRAQLFDAQLKLAEQKQIQVAAAESPHDNDDH